MHSRKRKALHSSSEHSYVGIAQAASFLQQRSFTENMPLIKVSDYELVVSAAVAASVACTRSDDERRWRRSNLCCACIARHDDLTFRYNKKLA